MDRVSDIFLEYGYSGLPNGVSGVASEYDVILGFGNLEVLSRVEMRNFLMQDANE